MRTHYDNLKIKRNASMEEVKAAYRSLAQKWHPDKHENKKLAERNFKLIKKAYDTLSDEQRRKEYDLFVLLNTKPSQAYPEQRNEKQNYPAEYQEQPVKENQSSELVNKTHNWVAVTSSLIAMFLLWGFSQNNEGAMAFMAIIFFVFLGTAAVLALDHFNDSRKPFLFKSSVACLFLAPWLITGGIFVFTIPVAIPSALNISIFKEMPETWDFLFYISSCLGLMAAYVLTIFWLADKLGLSPDETPYKNTLHLSVVPRYATVASLSFFGLAVFYLSPFIITPVESYVVRPLNLFVYMAIVYGVVWIGYFALMAAISEDKNHDVTINELSHTADNIIESITLFLFGNNPKSLYSSAVVAMFAVATITYVIGYNPYA